MDLAYTYDRVSSLQRHFPPSTDASNLGGRFGTDWLMSVSMTDTPTKATLRRKGLFQLLSLGHSHLQ